MATGHRDDLQKSKGAIWGRRFVLFSEWKTDVARESWSVYGN